MNRAYRSFPLSSPNILIPYFVIFYSIGKSVFQNNLATFAANIDTKIVLGV